MPPRAPSATTSKPGPASANEVIDNTVSAVAVNVPAIDFMPLPPLDPPPS